MEQNSPILWVRHAQSLYNTIEHEARQKGLEEFEYRYKMDTVDCTISETGHKQTLEARERLKTENVKIILASPLRRTLLTTQKIFEDHPCNPKVIVIPHLREKIHSSCDIPDDINVIEKEFPYFDFSLFKDHPRKHLWYIDHLHNDTVREEIYKEIESKGIENDIHKIKELILTRLADFDPHGLETELDLFHRMIKSKDVIRGYLKELQEGEKMTVVTHFLYLCALTAKSYKDGLPVEGMRFQNCQVVERHLDHQE